MKKKMNMTFKTFLPFVFMMLTAFVYAQDNEDKKTEQLYKKYSAQAAEEIEKGEFAQAEALYRKALSKKPEGDKATYNFGNLYFENEKGKQSGLKYLQSAKASDDKLIKHKNYHNLGNLMMSDENYEGAVEAYKNALRNNPNDEETRYNFALAKQKLQKQKNDGQGQDQNKDQNKDQEKKDQNKDENEGGQGDNEEKKEQDQKNSDEGTDDKESKKENENSKKDPKEGNQDKQKKPSQPKPQKGQMSEQQIKNLLQAIQNKEKDTQEKLNAKKVKGKKVKTEKDW